MRSHALVQSTPILEAVLQTTPLRCDVSLLLSHAPRTDPFEFQWKGDILLRIPYHWEDDVEMLRHAPSWALDDARAGEGLRVFDFHPIHVLLNSADMGPYEQLKASVPSLGAATIDQVRPLVHEGPGSGTLFAELVAKLGDEGGGDRICDIHAAWEEDR